MSRTYKDRPYHKRHPEDDINFGREYISYEAKYRRWNVETREYSEYTYIGYSYYELPGIRTKKRKEVDTKNHWMSTPSWWNRLYNNVPMRRRGRAWEAKVKLQDLEETDPPGVSKKPHQYFW